MKRFLSKELRRKFDELGRIQALEEEGKWAEALQEFGAIRTLARKAGIGHGMVSWRLAVCSDNLGKLEAAMEYAVEALETDPPRECSATRSRSSAGGSARPSPARAGTWPTRPPRGSTSSWSGSGSLRRHPR